MKKICVAVAAAVLLPAAASAAPVAGGRVAAIVGWDNVGVDLGAFGAGRESRGGFVYGIEAGYDFATGKTVALGIDVEAADATTDFSATNGADRVRASAGRDLYVGGRITGAVSDRVNVYGKVGYTNARIKAVTTLNGVTTRDASNADGIRLGLGTEFSLTGKTFLGAEYRYSNYEAGVDRHQVVGSIGFRF